MEGFVNHGDGAIEEGVVVPLLLLGVAGCLTDVHSIVECPPTSTNLYNYIFFVLYENIL